MYFLTAYTAVFLHSKGVVDIKKCWHGAADFAKPMATIVAKNNREYREGTNTQQIRNSFRNFYFLLLATFFVQFF